MNVISEYSVIWPTAVVQQHKQITDGAQSLESSGLSLVAL